MKSRKFISLCAVVLFGNATIGQCPTVEKMGKGVKGKGGYGISTQSKSGALISGQSYEMSFIAQDNYDYRITSGTFESDKGNVPFEVYEMVTEKDPATGEYKKIKKVLIDSDGSAPVEITTDKARKLMIKVTLDGGDPKKPACVGVLIEDKKTTKIGL